MNYDRLIKLEKLIKESPILNAQEREEWLTLLDLMNDKQLLELEKILQVQNKSREEKIPELKPEAIVSSPFHKEKEPSQTLAEVLAKTHEPKKDLNLSKMDGPKLGHLMNLPSGVSSGMKKNQSAVTPSALLKNFKHQAPLKQTTVSKLPEKNLQTSKGAFWNKIKDILSEKELKSGRESIFTEKELLAPKVLPQKIEPFVPPTSTIERKPESKIAEANITFKPLVAIPKFQKPGFDIPVPKPKPRPQAVSLKFILKQTDKVYQQKPTFPPPVLAKAPVLSKPAIAPVIPQKGGLTIEDQQKEIETSRPKQRTDFVSATLDEKDLKDTEYINALKQKTSFGKEGAKIAAGIKLDEVQAKADSARVFGPLKGLRPEDKAKSASRSFEKIKLLSIEDLKKLTSDNFAYEDEAMLAKNIKEFIKKFGYHDIIFAIEQSPLFKSYIETGTRVLSGQGQFNGGGNNNQVSELLKQEEFEKVADLLMEIQTA